MLSIKDNIAEIERSLSDFARDQLPFAIAMTLNDTAADAKVAEERALERELDRPTPFTKRGIYMRRASKRRLESAVGVKRVQAAYLKLQASGGVRRPKGKALLLPVNQRKNTYGNMPKGAVRRASARDDTFVASKRGGKQTSLRPGIYRRVGRGRKKLSLLVAFEDRAAYKPKLPFERVASRTGELVIADHFARRFKQALATAR